MELNEIWLSSDAYSRQREYLFYSFKQIETELFSSFDILPLSEYNLNVSSMFFANLCLRLYPLLTIGFNTLTFGERMKSKIEEWKRGKAQAQFREEMEHIKLETICQELIQLREKNLADEDGIRDYFKFYRRTDLGIEEFFEITGTVKSRPTLGRIKYSEKTTPFEKKNFNKYLDTRNSIEHRGKVEATLRETYVAISALYLIIEKLSSRKISRSLYSNIFIGVYDKIMRRSGLNFDS